MSNGIGERLFTRATAARGLARRSFEGNAFKRNDRILPVTAMLYLRKFHNKVVGIGHLTDFDHQVHIGIWIPNLQVFLDGVVEQCWFLLDNADHVSEPFQI